MTTISLGVVGADPHLATLAERLAPASPFHSSRVQVTAWAPSPGGAGLSELTLAKTAGASLVESWQPLTTDRGLDALIIAAGTRERVSIAEAALANGKVVLCPIPVAMTPEELDTLEATAKKGMGLLLAPGQIANTPAGRHALDGINADELGPLHSIYLSVRRPFATDPFSPGVLAQLGWEALDFLLAATGSEATRVYVNGGRLFGRGAAEDTATLVVRFASKTIATVELSRCLPSGISAPGFGEIEAELVGTRRAVRIEPHTTGVRVYGDAVGGGRELRPWLWDPILFMVEGLVRVLQGVTPAADYLERQRKLLALMQAAQTSLDTGEVVELES